VAEDSKPGGSGAGGPAGGDGAEKSGPELARAAVEAALSKRRTQQRRKAVMDPATGEPRRRRGYTGPGPDPRDPQPFGTLLERMMKARGWQKPKAEATVFGEWERVVGADIAAHCRPIKLEDGELTVEAESTAWATQLRMLAGRLIARIAGEVGHNVVKKLHIQGPNTPSWSRGPMRVRGRGPRDTYG
jgi:predicted nucleic acid-binding Zn ribbon protein